MGLFNKARKQIKSDYPARISLLPKHAHNKFLKRSK